MLRRSFLLAAPTAAFAGVTVGLTAGCSGARAFVPPDWPPSRSTGALATIEVIDRDSGAALPLWQHEGRLHVAGTPGRRYAVALRNKTGGRVLAVVAVDGINAVSGETADWHQTGYVLGPGHRYEVRGWRKSTERIAAFEFTALPDSYAARTGRPQNVGVIGVALFRERAQAVSVPLEMAPPRASDQSGAQRPSPAAPAAASAPPPSGEAAASAAPTAESAARSRQSRAEDRLGTGHGRSETSRVGTTQFERASIAPDEIVAIHYDSHANLVARGVIPRHWGRAPKLEPNPEPFPGRLGFVPDPPR